MVRQGNERCKMEKDNELGIPYGVYCNGEYVARRYKRREEERSEDAVHPNHYKSGEFECIDVMKAQFGAEAVRHFCHLNAFKYLYRAEKKNGVEDLKKAKYYIEKEIELTER